MCYYCVQAENQNMKVAFLIIFTFFFCVGEGEAQSIEKIVINEQDPISGYYLAVKPTSGRIDTVLVLLPGYGQQPESIFSETKLHIVGQSNNILTIGFAEGPKLYADEKVQDAFTKVLKDIVKRYGVDKNQFVIGGFSAGGAVALRYVELCIQFPEKFPIDPKGVFTVDAPIDIFWTWDNLEKNFENKYNEVAVQEAEWVMNEIKKDHGVPMENVDYYKKINAFAMDKQYGENEKWLKNIAVRTYHDLDVAWRLNNRNQTVNQQNFLVTSELINRLLLMGNQRAEFMQSLDTGYRSDGTKHPHSWSIVDEKECIDWIKKITAG